MPSIQLPSGSRPPAPATSLKRISTQLPLSPASARTARELAREVTGAPEHIPVALVVTELVTNAVKHAHAGPSVCIHRHDDTVRVEVSDDGDGRPVVLHVEAMATSGRGMALIDALCERWGVEQVPGGKTVWAELDLRRDASA